MKQFLVGLVLSMVGVFGQTPSIPFSTPAPPFASIIGVTYSRYTTPGAGNTYYYWIVTHYTSGDVFNPTPFEVDNVNVNDPTIAHSLNISFNPVQNNVTYSILRTTTTTSPTFPCTCLVGTTTGQTYILDTNISLFAYTPSFAKNATGDIRLNNKDYSTPSFEATVNGVTSLIGGSTNAVTVNGASLPASANVVGTNIGGQIVAQTNLNGVTQVGANPGTCTPNVTQDIFNTTTGIRYYCSATNVWTQGASLPGNVVVPSGTLSVGKAVLDPVTGLNNVQPALLPKWRLALAKVRDGVADAKILCIGDSRTAGFGGTNSPSPYNSTPVNQSLDSWPRRLATLLSVYIPSAPGLAVPTCALCVTSPDARWVYGTGWTLYGYGFGGGIGTDGSAAYGTGSPTGNLVFTPGAVGTYDSFRIYYGTHPTAYGTLTVTASGGTPVVINTHIAQSTTSLVALAASAAITNTVTISCSGTCRVDGIEPFLSTTATVRVGNAGVASSNTFHWSYNGFASSLWAINAYAPDLAIIALGTNDGTGSLSVAVVTANLTTIITAARLSGDVILVSPPVSGTNPTGANEILYRPAMKALAASLGVAFLDMQEQWGGVYQPLMMDPGVATLVHFNNLGSWDFAGAVKEFLLRVR